MRFDDAVLLTAQGKHFVKDIKISCIDVVFRSWETTTVFKLREIPSCLQRDDRFFSLFRLFFRYEDERVELVSH